MKKMYLVVVLVAVWSLLEAQDVTLTFTTRDGNYQYVPFDRIVVTNLTKNWQETLFWPDSVISFVPNDIYAGDRGFKLIPNSPNPFRNVTNLTVCSLYEGDVSMQVVDINGRIVAYYNDLFQKPGARQFQIQLVEAGIYVLIARQNGYEASMKMLCEEGCGHSSIQYVGDAHVPDYVLHPSSSAKVFDPGDMMEYVGYREADGVVKESYHIKQPQESSQNFILHFGDLNFLCGSSTFSDYDGNIYHTLPVGGQCWTKENMRSIKKMDGTNLSYIDDTSSSIPLEERGYYYPHWAAMEVCPIGWHLPSDEEWLVLLNYVSSQEDYLCGTGTDMSGNAKALASTSWWSPSSGICTTGNNPTENNATGFSAVPAGFCVLSTFYSTYERACFASSTTHTQWYGSHEGPTTITTCTLFHDETKASLGGIPSQGRFNVRCLKD